MKKKKSKKKAVDKSKSAASTIEKVVDFERMVRSAELLFKENRQ